MSGRYAVRSGKRTDLPDWNLRYRFTMLERWLPRITARRLRGVVLKVLKVIEFIFQNLPINNTLRIKNYKKYLPTHRTDLEDLL